MENVQRAATMTLEKIGLHLELITTTCPVHGRIQAFRSIDPRTGEEYISKCPQCEIERMAKERVVYQERQEDPEVILAKKIEESGIPKNYRESTFANYRVDGYSDPRSEVKQECQQFLQTDKKNLVILGTTGVGKTHLGSALIRESLKSNKTAKYIKEGALLRLIKSTFGQKGKTEQSIIDEFASYDVLVIDEIGLSPWSEYNSQAITDIIDDRSNNGGKTVYLGNLDAETFKQHFNDQCLSRINSRKIILGLNTTDYRRTL